MANTSLGKDMDITPFYRLKFYPRTTDGVLHSVSESDKGKTICGKLISETESVMDEFIRHKNKCCEICKP